jgi:hypothetical protein
MMLGYSTLLKNGSIAMEWTITCHMILKNDFIKTLRNQM